MTEKPSLRLSEFLPYRLSVLSNTISEGIAQQYVREFGLSIRQWRLMAILGETPGLTATQIGERAAMDKVAVSRAVSGLIDLGYLRRETVEDDGRASMLHLTPVGLDVYDRIVPLALSFEQALTDALSTDDVDQFLQLLDRIAGVVSPSRQLW